MATEKKSKCESDLMKEGHSRQEAKRMCSERERPSLSEKSKKGGVEKSPDDLEDIEIEG